MAAQTSGILELSVSAVRYEGFLGSGAGSVGATIRHDTPRVSAGAQASLLIFESGNQILHGTLAAAWLAPVARRIHAEFSGSAGVARYADAPRYGHIMGRVRLHLSNGLQGAWAGGASGRSFVGGAAETPLELAAGAWTTMRGLAVGATVSRTWLADIAFSDVAATARARPGFLEMNASVGARLWDEGAGSGLWGNVRAHVRLTRRIAVLVQGGNYPADPVKGVLAARYVTAGLRLTAFPGTPAPAPALTRALRRTPSSAEGAQVRLQLAASAGDVRTFRVHATQGTVVELMGDFTDWRPVRLAEASPGIWEITLRVPPGIHRVNVRVDGGPWLVPLGTRTQQDDFGGAVGILVIG